MNLRPIDRKSNSLPVAPPRHIVIYKREMSETRDSGASFSCIDSLRLPIVSGNSTTSARSVHLRLGHVDVAASSTDAYSLTVDVDGELIAVTGRTPAAVFYGVQSLVNLAFPDGRLAALSVRDWPRFAYRGLHVDVARNWHSDATHMMRVVDAMATYKLNRLHLHLSDDEAWRLDIPGLPELTRVGSVVRRFQVTAEFLGV